MKEIETYITERINKDIDKKIKELTSKFDKLFKDVPHTTYSDTNRVKENGVWKDIMQFIIFFDDDVVLGTDMTKRLKIAEDLIKSEGMDIYYSSINTPKLYIDVVY